MSDNNVVNLHKHMSKSAVEQDVDLVPALTSAWSSWAHTDPLQIAHAMKFMAFIAHRDGEVAILEELMFLVGTLKCIWTKDKQEEWIAEQEENWKKQSDSDANETAEVLQFPTHPTTIH